MALHVFQYSGVSKAKFVIPIECLVNQQCTNTNARIVVSSAAIMSERQPPEHILLPEHSSHVKFCAMGSANLFGWGANERSKQPAKINIHSVQISFVNLSVASGETCNGSNKFIKKSASVSSRTPPCCKECFCLQRMPSMQPANDIQDPVCDFPCCSHTKCIQAICGIHLRQPQPRLFVWES